MGVKSLWNLLEPVGRPVLLETMEGKAMAIDSSIWIYQFQATMRDKEGRGLVNAHVVGFLRRICKLLFYGIKPVFVFDGGAPALKKSTIAERKHKKAGAAASHVKIAERLLAAQMRREALNQVQGASSKGKKRDGPVVIDENTVYLEDLDVDAPVTPKKPAASAPTESSPPSTSKKSRWRDHDPYKLPDVDLNEAIAKATSSNPSDPRLATEDELRAFIEEMRPEDFDVSSPAFRELPTEVQYEIIGDLRLKSRQTSYKRLQNMLRKARTPLDFSKEQIKNLKQRNSLTQQLLITTDTIGKAHVEIPIRIASERNKQYLLVKNEGAEGGWILGVRDEGTRSKPIEIDQDLVKPADEEEEENSEMEMEEVEISTPNTPHDPDLREYRRTMALNALAERYSPKKLAPLTTQKVVHKLNTKPLFNLDRDDPDAQILEEEDPELTAAIEASVETQEELDMQRAIEISRTERLASDYPAETNIGASTSRSPLDNSFSLRTPSRPPSPRVWAHSVENSDDEDLYTSPTRLETALSIGGASKKPMSGSTMFGTPSLLVSSSHQGFKTTLPDNGNAQDVSFVERRSMSASAVSPQKVSPTSTKLRRERATPIPVVSSDEEEMDEVIPPATSEVIISQEATRQISPPPVEVSPSDEDEDEDMEEVVPPPGSVMNEQQERSISVVSRTLGVEVETSQAVDTSIPSPVASASPEFEDVARTNAFSHPIPNIAPVIYTETAIATPDESSSDEEGSQHWSGSPSFNHALDNEDKPLEKPVQVVEDWDAAQEMDPQAEEGEYVRFMSQVRGKDLESVRREIDDEIRSLNQQRKAAMRDSEDITQQMISQIMMMLRLFGIPYITAPMEAEAQCAELLALELVDGIITDDSDVFLFGGARIFKNMFNQSKTVECFLLSDLERELGLDRDKLIRLAYLLGSDYTEGLPGVGPVVAMELLTEFPDKDGLHKFKEWWRRVQSGKDKPEESASKFRKRFKKRFKELFLPEDWPNPAVRDAYYHPTVDHSEEPFKWGLPDLDALRDFFGAELGWNQGKVDDLLLPIIQKMNKRSQQGALNKQGNLTGSFDVPSGGAAPRKRQAYASKRLQQVVSEFRKKQKAESNAPSPESSSEQDDTEPRPKKRRKASETPSASSTRKNGGVERGTGRGRGRGRGRGSKATRGKRAAKGKARAQSGSEEDEFNEKSPAAAGAIPDAPLSVELRPRPKPRPRRMTEVENAIDSS
ncbi:unnamed protein product [Somion occarium]|uniref:PIN domain-like protein n=1 Tax=Somion occarium TaxID=3059160 RepID=A0ABP1E9H6_9APHY